MSKPNSQLAREIASAARDVIASIPSEAFQRIESSEPALAASIRRLAELGAQAESISGAFAYASKEACLLRQAAERLEAFMNMQQTG